MIKRVFLIMIGILASLAVSFYPSFAQDIDISNMDNAQLMVLLQAIMQKLEEETADKSQEAPIVTTTPAAEDTPGSIAEADSFRIYENKKLVVESIPDWFFIRNDRTEEPQDKEYPTEPQDKEYPTEAPDREYPTEAPAKENPTDVTDSCIICPYYDIETGQGIDCFSIC